MADLTAFKQYYKLADMLIEKATKEQVAECARLLALNLTHHEARLGELPLEETLAMIDVKALNRWNREPGGCAGQCLHGLGEAKHSLGPEFSAEITLSARSNGSLKELQWGRQSLDNLRPCDFQAKTGMFPHL